MDLELEVLEVLVQEEQLDVSRVQVVRELAALELALVGGGAVSSSFV